MCESSVVASSWRKCNLHRLIESFESHDTIGKMNRKGRRYRGVMDNPITGIVKRIYGLRYLTALTRPRIWIDFFPCFLESTLAEAIAKERRNRRAKSTRFFAERRVNIFKISKVRRTNHLFAENSSVFLRKHKNSSLSKLNNTYKFNKSLTLFFSESINQTFHSSKIALHIFEYIRRKRTFNKIKYSPVRQKDVKAYF